MHVPHGARDAVGLRGGGRGPRFAVWGVQEGAGPGAPQMLGGGMAHMHGGMARMQREREFFIGNLLV